MKIKARFHFKKAIMLLILLLLAVIMAILTSAGLEKEEYYIKNGDSFVPKCNYSFLNRFLKTEDVKEGKTDYEAILFFRKLPYTVITLDFDESPVLCRTKEAVILEKANLTKEADIQTPGGKQEDDGVYYEKAGNYTIDIEDHGLSFQKEITVVDDARIYLKKGESWTLPAKGNWTVQDKKMELKSGKAIAAKSGKTKLIIRLGQNEIEIPVTIVNLMQIISLEPSEEYKLPGEDGVWTCEVKEKNGKISTEKCGIYPYSYSYHGLDFQGEVFVTSFPKKLGLVLGSEQKMNLKGVKGESFISSDEEVADISEYGTVIARKEGSCDITTVKDDIKKTCHILIMDLPESYLGDDRHNNEIILPENMDAEVKNHEIASVEDGALHLNTGGETEVVLKKDGYEFTIPLYVSSYENGDAKGYATKYQSDGSKNTFTVFCQHSYSYRNFNTFLAHNGCSTCSLSCILSAYTDYQDPVDVMEEVEKQEIGESAWLSHHHNGKDGTAMPMTLYAVNRCLNSQGIETDYVPVFDRNEMKEDIWDSLSEGKVVVIEINKTNQITGVTDRYWSGSVHTVVLLGCFGDDGVYVGDPANIRRGSGVGRIKETTLSQISEYMWSCKTEEPDSFYWNGKAEGGGYIKISGKTE